jgi:hemoglobin-like flavoprotein
MSSKVCLAQYEGDIFFVLPAMTAQQVRIVQETFRQIAPHAAEAVHIFYEDLFRIAPETRRLFPHDMAAQKSKLIQMLTTVVNSLTNASAISDHLADLGRRHASYDVTELHYAYVGQALLSMLRRVFGPNFTEEIHDAWVAAYSMLARTMLEAARLPYSTGDFFSRVLHGVMTSQYGVSDVAESPQVQVAQKPSTSSVRKMRSF